MTGSRDDIDLEAFGIALTARRAELAGLTETSRDARATVELDQTMVGRLSRMDALQGQQMALEQDRRRKAEIQRIDAALDRLEKGDYGYCSLCDEPIPGKRLQLDPAIGTCINCAGAK
ncbi:MAG: TraR/DksA family transcriptional regulator [Alphaproteobacteria bacterium]